MSDSRHRIRSMAFAFIAIAGTWLGTPPASRAEGTSAAARGMPHAFLATGAETRIVNPQGAVLWRDPRSTRDGWVLPDGDLLLVVSTSKEQPGGAVVRIDRKGAEKFRFNGTQAEVNTAQLLDGGNILLTEAGPKPRILEVRPDGGIALEVPIACQLTNHHMQSRMTRKLAGGNYLVPQLLDKVVREYTPEGRVAWEVRTPHWPFTAIRLPNGNTLVGCTYGNLVVEFDREGGTVWKITNDDLPEPLIKDACGVQRLANGNTVITSYGIGSKRTKLFEVTPAREVVWTYTDASPHGIHHFQILTPEGLPLPGMAWR